MWGFVSSRGSSNGKGKKKKKTKDISELLNVPISKDTKAMSKGKLKKLADACDLDAEAIVSVVFFWDQPCSGLSLFCSLFALVTVVWD